MGGKQAIKFVVLEALWILSQFTSAASAFDVTTTNNAGTLANAAAQSGLLIVSDSFTGASNCAGTFVDGPFNIGSGTILTTGKATDAELVNGQVRTHPNSDEGTGGSTLCNSIVGNKLTTYDAAVLTIDVTVPVGYAGVTAYFIFASEEYPE